MGITVTESIAKSSIPSTMVKAFACPKYLDGNDTDIEVKSPNGEEEGFLVTNTECVCIIAAFLNAVAICLGQNKDAAARKWLTFSTTDGIFIGAFYIEMNKTDQCWEMGCSFDAGDLEKVDPKNIIRADDESGAFAGKMRSPFYHCSYLRGVGSDSPMFDQRIVRTTIQSLKRDLEAMASEDGHKIKMLAEIPINSISSQLMATRPEAFEDTAATQYDEDCGEFFTKKTKTGISITYVPGEANAPYIKDDASLSVIVDSLDKFRVPYIPEEDGAAAQ